MAAAARTVAEARRIFMTSPRKSCGRSSAHLTLRRCAMHGDTTTAMHAFRHPSFLVADGMDQGTRRHRQGTDCRQINLSLSQSRYPHAYTYGTFTAEEAQCIFDSLFQWLTWNSGFRRLAAVSASVDAMSGSGHKRRPLQEAAFS